MDVPAEYLIELVQKQRCLWDISDNNYKNVKKKVRIWKDIADECHTTVEEVKKRWKRLRDSYSRELSKKLKSGEEAKNPEEEWKFFSILEFLRPSLRPRKTTSNYQSDDAIGFSEEQELFKDMVESPAEVEPKPSSSTSINTPVTPKNFITPTTRKRRHDEESGKLEDNLLKTMQTVQAFLQNPAAEEEDEDTLFCKSIVKKLKTFPIKIKNEAKLEILKILCEKENNLEK